MNMNLDMITEYNEECGKLIKKGRYNDAAGITNMVLKSIKTGNITDEALDYWHDLWNEAYKHNNFI